MLDALIGFWIGTTTLSLSAGGAYAIGGSSLLDDVPLHGGRWTVHDTIIEFNPDLGNQYRDTVAARKWRGPFRCTYTVEDRTLRLADCPYKGSYLSHRPRSKATP